MDLISIFRSTMYTCETNPFLQEAIAASISGQQVIFDGDSVPETAPRFSSPASRRLSDKRSFEAAKPYALEGKRVCVLNFASFVNPGGGVTRGCRAQEECLCRISTLYPALIDESAASFYKSHRDAIDAGLPTRKGNDDCIYTPGVKVICEDSHGCEPLPEDEWYTVDVVTSAAPDQRFAYDETYRPSDEELYEVMLKRISRIYALAALHEADVLIMGAFGCGVFGNLPEIVMQSFETATERFTHHFEVIEFAIPDPESRNYRAFAHMTDICRV